MKRMTRLKLTMALAAVSIAPAVRGQVSGTWVNDGVASWSIASNWSSNPLYPDGGGTASFGFGTGTAMLDVPVSLSGVRFETLIKNGIYWPGTGPGILTFSGPTSIHVAVAPYRIDRTDYFDPLAQTIAAPIAGFDGLTKTGPGQIQLGGTNTFTGQIIVQGGTLQALSNAALGNLANSIVLDGGALRGGTLSMTIARPITAAIAGATLSFQNGANIDGVISGPGPVSVRGGTSPVLLRAANTFSGPLTLEGIAGGTTRLTADGVVVTNLIHVSSGVFSIDNTNAFLADRIPDTASIDVSDGRLLFTGMDNAAFTEQFATLTLNGGGFARISTPITGPAKLSAGALLRLNRATFISTGTALFLGNGTSLLIGGGGEPGTTTQSIVPFALFNQNLTNTGTLVTYGSGGLRPLTAPEFFPAMPSGVTTHNVKLTSGGTISVDSPVTINSLTLHGSASQVLLSGPGTITVTSGAIVALNPDVIFAPIQLGAAEGVFSGSVIFGGGGVHGTNGVTFAGMGISVGGAVNSTYTGITTVNGTLSIGGSVPASGPGPLGADTSPVVLAGNAAWLSGSGASSITFARDLLVKAIGSDTQSRSPVLGPRIIVSGDVVLERWLDIAGQVAITGDITGPGGIGIPSASTPVVILSGDNTFGGGINIGTADFAAGSDTAFGTGTVSVGNGTMGGTLRAVNGPRILSNPFVTNGALVRFAGDQQLTLAGPFSLNGTAGSFTIDAATPPPLISGNISDGWVTAAGPGTLRLSGSNSQISTVVRTLGSLRVESNGGLGGTSRSTTVSGTLELVGGLSIPPHPMILSGTLQSNGISSWGGDVNLSFDPNIRVDSGFLSILGELNCGTASLRKRGDGTLAVRNIRTPSLQLLGGTIQVSPDGTASATSKVQALNLAGNLDLTNNDFILDYVDSTQLSTIRSQIASGQIHSSLADAARSLGSADNTELGLTTFSGQPVDPTSILITYTFLGDADLDGDVDVADLGRLASSWQTSNVWTGGDFDYSGFVDVADLGLLASNWQAGVDASQKPTAGPWALTEALAALGLPTGAIPEPASVAVLLIGASLLARRRANRVAPPAS